MKKKHFWSIGLLVMLTLSGCFSLKSYGTLIVNSDPDNAEVYIEGLKTTISELFTPLTLNLQPGTYTIKVHKNGYKPYEDQVVIVKNNITTVSVNLEQLDPAIEHGSLTLITDLDGASIWFGNNFYGYTIADTSQVIQLEPGLYTLRITKGSVDYSQNIEILSGVNFMLELELNPKEYSVNIGADSYPAEIFYWHDKNPSANEYPVATSLGQISDPKVFRLEEPGVYWFYAKKSGRVFSSQAVNVLDKTQTVNVELESVSSSEARGDVSTLIKGKPLFAPWELEDFVMARNPNNNPYNIYVAKYYLYFGSLLDITGDWAYCQSIHETGWFKFGGDAVPEQNNYAGIGTTGGGVKGAYFDTPEEGVLAQIQHLWAYGVPRHEGDPWPVQKYPYQSDSFQKVDPRYHLVTRPQTREAWLYLNGRWAVPGSTYAQMIWDLHNQLLNYLGY
ncbi:MAG TPA: PEGA domain-containing protein [Firmicutes bacterium]|jgi:hypothetical protein|nr:PEGA domain-containing protein [Bacillota bacterium]